MTRRKSSCFPLERVLLKLHVVIILRGPALSLNAAKPTLIVARIMNLAWTSFIAKLMLITVSVKTYKMN